MKRRDDVHQRDSRLYSTKIQEQSSHISMLYEEVEQMMDGIVERMITKVDQYKPDPTKPRSERSRLQVFPEKRLSQALYEWVICHQDSN